MSYVDEVKQRVADQNLAQPEFLQAVEEVLESLRPVIERNEAAYRRDALLERLTTSERNIIFSVPWVDDNGNVQDVAIGAISEETLLSKIGTILPD